jgi:hypothetical protein
METKDAETFLAREVVGRALKRFRIRLAQRGETLPGAPVGSSGGAWGPKGTEI